MRRVLDLDSQEALLRALILGRLGRCGDRQTIEKARELFISHLQTKNNLHPDLRLAVSVFCSEINLLSAFLCSVEME